MKKLLSNFTYILLLAACPIFVSAQEMTLEECISVGIKNHPDFQTQLLAAEGAEADVRIAKSQQMPRLNMEVYQSTNVGRSIDRFTNAYIDQLYNSTFANASFSVPIYQGFQLKHNIRQNELLREAATTGIESARNQLSIRIVHNYLVILASQELVIAAERQVGLSQTQADRVTKQIEAGTVGRPVLLQLQTQVANDEFALISAQNNVEIARLLLFQSMNRRPDNSVDFTPLEKEVVLTNFDRSEFTTSINQLPEIKSQEIRIKSFDSQLRSVKSDNLPSLDAFANYGSFFASSNPEENFFEQLNGTRNGSVTIGLTIPIFASFRTRPRAQAVSVQKKVAENQLVSNKLQLTQAFEQALQSYKNAVKRYQNVQKQVDINQENLNAVTSQVDAGTVNVVELLLARTNFDRAQNNFIQTKYELLLQRMLLDFYRTGAFNF
ncbi:MAG: TolC family protein [Spirosomataceae bacterium]